jgi:uncharacterized protein
MDSWTTYILVGAILGLAAMSQSAVGFGYALFAVPLLVWCGIPLNEAVMLVVSCSTFQAAVGVRNLRHSTPWRLSLICTAMRVVGLLAGVYGMKRLVELDPARIRVTVGALLCLLVVAQYFWKPRQAESIRWGWATLAFTTSGLLSGLVGMGGPPLVLWAMARHGWTSQKTRAFLFSVYLVANTIQIVLLHWTFGIGMLRSVALGALFSPLVYGCSRVGLSLGNRMSRERLRTVAYLLLLAIGVSAVAPYVWEQWK